MDLSYAGAISWAVAGVCAVTLGGCGASDDEPAAKTVVEEVEAVAVEAAAVEEAAAVVDADAPSSTEYCPRQPHFSEASQCYVLDQNDERVLIHHGDPSRGLYYLEDRMGEASEYLDVPLSVTNLKPGGYTAKMIPGEIAIYVFDGSAQLVVPYAGPME